MDPIGVESPTYLTGFLGPPFWERLGPTFSVLDVTTLEFFFPLHGFLGTSRSRSPGGCWEDLLAHAMICGSQILEVYVYIFTYDI